MKNSNINDEKDPNVSDNDQEDSLSNQLGAALDNLSSLVSKSIISNEEDPSLNENKENEPGMTVNENTIETKTDIDRITDSITAALFQTKEETLITMLESPKTKSPRNEENEDDANNEIVNDTNNNNGEKPNENNDEKPIEKNDETTNNNNENDVNNTEKIEENSNTNTDTIEENVNNNNVEENVNNNNVEENVNNNNVEENVNNNNEENENIQENENNNNNNNNNVEENPNNNNEENENIEENVNDNNDNVEENVNNETVDENQNENNYNDDDEGDVPPLEFEEEIPLFSDEELAAAVDKQIKKKILPPLEMRPSVINYAKRIGIQKIITEEYDYAAALDEVIAQNQASLTEDLHNTNTENQNSTIQERLQAVEDKRKQVQAKYDDRLAALEKKRKSKFEELQRRHQREIEDFEQRWADPTSLLKFNKPSPRLLQLKRQQKCYAMAHDFESAKQIKNRADALQREETIIANKKAAEAMKIEYNQLINRQQLEEINFNQYEDLRKDQLEARRTKKLQKNDNQKNQLDTKMKAPKIMKKATVLIPSVQSRSAQKPRPTTGLISHRTRNTYTTFKKSSETTRLDVKVIDTKTIIKPMTPTTGKRPKTSLS